MTRIVEGMVLLSILSLTTSRSKPNADSKPGVALSVRVASLTRVTKWCQKRSRNSCQPCETAIR